MDKTTHEIRLANWKPLIEQCISRPKGQTTKQWLEEHGISEKQYYYWLRKVRARAYGEMGSQGLMAPAMSKESETVFAEIPCRREENMTPLKARDDCCFRRYPGAHPVPNHEGGPPCLKTLQASAVL